MNIEFSRCSEQPNEADRDIIQQVRNLSETPHFSY